MDATTSTNGAAVLDLTSIIPVDQTVIDINKPGTAEPSGWKVTLAGPSHQKAIAFDNTRGQRNLQKSKQLDAQRLNGRKIKPDDADLDAERRSTVEWVVSRIITWTTFSIGSETFAFSDAVATDLLLRPEMGFAFNQIVEAIGDEKSFTRR